MFGCFHVYERACVDAYREAAPEHKNLMMFYNASKYEEGFNNYIDAEDDAIGYFFQDVEAAANKYSFQASKEYISFIEEQKQKTT